MEKVLQEEMEIIMKLLDCPKEFVCYKSGFDRLCRAEDIGSESFLQCLEGNSSDCNFSLFQGGLYFCKCPLRIYIKKNLHK
jgi:hypothetical protein